MTGRTILLIEDDTVFAQVVTSHLMAHGHSVVVATEAAEARRRLASGIRPDLVLLDVNLPDESGWALLRDGTLAAAGGPPVVIVSGTAISPRRLAEFRLAGYLPKPFPTETLTAIVERLLAQPTRSEEGEAWG